MKKFVRMLAAAMLVLAVCMTAFACGEKKPVWKFDTPDAMIEYEVDGTTQWSPVITVNVKVVGGNGTVMYAGQVKAKTPDNMASHFLKAIVVDKGWANSGIDEGFVTILGDFTNNTNENRYWGYKINGESPSFGCSTFQLREGDYMLWAYEKMTV